MRSIPANGTRLRAYYSSPNGGNSRAPGRVARFDRGELRTRPHRCVRNFHLDRLAREKIDEPAFDPRLLTGIRERAAERRHISLYLKRVALASAFERGRFVIGDNPIAVRGAHDAVDGAGQKMAAALPEECELGKSGFGLVKKFFAHRGSEKSLD